MIIKRFWSSFFALLCIGVICFTLNFSVVLTQPTSSNYPSDQQPLTALAGSYHRTMHILYAQNLGEATGYCVQPINRVNGQTNADDLLMVGGFGVGSWRSLSGYLANTSTGYPVIQSNDDNIVTSMVRYVDPNDNNTKVFYGEEDNINNNGKIAEQRGVNPAYTSSPPTVTSDGYISTNGPVESICMGNFSLNHVPGIAGVCTTGDVYLVLNLNTPNVGTLISSIDNLGGTYSTDIRQVKHTIAAINDLDHTGVGTQDLIVGHMHNVTAISSNTSFPIIWTTAVSGIVGSVLPITDVTGDGKQDIVVGTASGLYLLSGSNGTILTSLTNAGTYFRDMVQFSDFNGDGVKEILTGNWQGNIYIWDVNPASATFGQVLANLTSTDQVWSFLNVGDLNGDGIDEFAVGADGFVGVVLGNNATWYWAGSPSGVGYWYAAQSIPIYDMALVSDKDGDGFKDIAVVGGYQDDAMFILSSKGQLGFWYDLSGYGTVDSNCSTASHTFTYVLYVNQAKNLSVTTKVIIDGTDHQMNLNSTIINWVNGVEFIYSTTLGTGTHTFSFSFTDTTNDTALLPTTGHYSGPTVGSSCNSSTTSTGGLIPGTIDSFVGFPWFGVIGVVLVVSFVLRRLKK